MNVHMGNLGMNVHMGNLGLGNIIDEIRLKNPQNRLYQC